MPSVVVCGRASRASSPRSTQPGSNKQHLSRAVRSWEAGRSSPPSVALQSSGRRPGAGSPSDASCQHTNAQQMFPSRLARSPDPPETNPNLGWESVAKREGDKHLLVPGVLAEGLVVPHHWRRRKEEEKTCGPNRARSRRQNLEVERNISSPQEKKNRPSDCCGTAQKRQIWFGGLEPGEPADPEEPGTSSFRSQKLQESETLAAS